MRKIEEIWFPLKGFENYLASNYGRIKGLKSGKILKPSKDKGGYLHLSLYKNGVKSNHFVHKVIADTFIPNPHNLPYINHKDEDKTNNFVWVNPDGTVDLEKSNLEWCDTAYNNKYGTRGKRISSSLKNHPSKSFKISQYTINRVFIKEWESAKEIKRQTGWDDSRILDACRGDNNVSHGYIWRFSSCS